MAKKTYLTHTFQKIQLAKSFFRRIEIYFTLRADEQMHQYTLILSHLPPLKRLFHLLPQERFSDKYLIFYFGSHSDLTYDHLSHAGIAFEALPFAKQTLCCLHVTSEQREKLEKLSVLGHDWWCLTQSEKPHAEKLQELGIIGNPSAFKRKKPDLQQEILINYFMDPSYHGFAREDFEILISELFIRGFKYIFRDLTDQPPAIQKLHALKNFSITFPSPALETDLANLPAVNMQSFHLRGGRNPSIKRINWFTGQRERLRWEKNSWSSLQALETTRLGSIAEIVSQYLTPLFLVPIALVVIPITLALWPLIALMRWIMKKQERE